MAKPIIHVGVSVSTDGVIPGQDNIIGVSACIGDIFLFDQNVYPVDGRYHDSPFWSKHPEEFKALQRDHKSLPEAMAMFAKWLDQWQGRLVACCSIIDFWHLFPAMMKHTGGCPFGTLPLDAASYYCAISGNKVPGKITDQVKPLEVAKERWKMVTSGVMPTFGSKKAKPTKKKDLEWDGTGVIGTWARQQLRPTRDLFGQAAQAIRQQVPTPPVPQPGFYMDLNGNIVDALAPPRPGR